MKNEWLEAVARWEEILLVGRTLFLRVCVLVIRKQASREVGLEMWLRGGRAKRCFKKLKWWYLEIKMLLSVKVQD